MTIDHALDPLLQRFATEVDQQPYGLVQKTEVGQKLLGMNGSDPLDGLDLHHKPAIDDQVCLERGREADAFKFDIDDTLTFDPIAHPAQSFGKNGFVDALQEPGAEVAMEPESNIEHVAAYLIDVLHRRSSSPRLRASSEPIKFP
jgi:hypothetical protein